MTRSSMIVVLLAGLASAGCTVSREGNPAFGCETDSECGLGGRCERGFCITATGDAGTADGGDCEGERLCNAADDDCDGTIDEFATEACETGLAGACGDGSWVCTEGAPSCARTTVPVAETCNGEDDDCDQTVDEIAPLECYPAATLGCSDSDGDGVLECRGTCRAGIQDCGGGLLSACAGFVEPTEEVCTTSGLGADEDCDGQIDEGCECTGDQACYGGPADTAGVGACRAGVQMCTDGALEAACDGQVTPTAESCANTGADDNCNGVMDDVPGLGDPCVASEAVGECRLGSRRCGTADELECSPREAREERCDSVDDDCDGRVDEAFDLSTDPMHCGGCGVECGSDETCCGGSCVDTRSEAAHCGACAADGGESCGTTGVCCGGACADAESCGSCAEDCAAEGRECCRGACVDIVNDENNCGGCGMACGEGQLCCNSVCVGSNEDHCGQSCSDCEGSDLCCDGACTPISNETCNACNVACSTGECCDSGCVDTQVDRQNCGVCGMACPAGQLCSQGNCCPTGQTFCDGMCRDLSDDDNNCGTCGTTCTGLSVCCGGSCQGLGLGCD